MKLVIAMMQHETNTFSPLETDWGAFGRGLGQDAPPRDERVLELLAGTGTAIAAFIDAARGRNADVVTPIAAYAEPSGRVDQAAFDRIATVICDAVADGCDAVLLDLHGAMVTDEYPDGEGELLKRLRMVDSSVPIGVALDFHTNLSAEMVANATVITGYCTYPHVDMYETGARCARTIFRMLDGEVAPRMVWGRLPLLTAMVRQDPSREPMFAPMARAVAAESDGAVLNASVFGGFPLADIPQVGLSTVVVTDNDSAAGHALRDAILTDAWAGREGFRFDSEPLEKTVATAKALKDGPIVLADYCDNCGAGGPADDMTVIAEALRQGLDGVIAGPLYDPKALAILREAGVGATVTVAIGGNHAGSHSGAGGMSLELSGTVTAISDGRFFLEGEMMAGFPVDLRGAAVLETEALKLVVAGARVEPYAPQFFTHFGIEPRDGRFIILKSRQHFRAGFESIARHILLARGAGVCDENYAEKPFKHLHRPMYPLDPETKWISESDAL